MFSKLVACGCFALGWSMAGAGDAQTSDKPQFGAWGALPESPGADAAIWGAIGTAGPVDASRPLASPISDFYLTNPLARASETMAECSQLLVGGAAKMAAE